MEDDERYIVFGSIAEGKIQAAEDQQEHLEAVTERLASGEYYANIMNAITVPVRCISGRRGPEGAGVLAPNTSGGTFSLAVARDLVYGSGKSTREMFNETLQQLIEKGLPVGGHTDSHAHGDTCGCSSIDRLQVIYQYMLNNREIMKYIPAMLGANLSDDEFDAMIENIRARTEFSSPREIIGELKLYADEEFVPELQGPYREVAVVVNYIPGTTLNRDALAADYPDYQAFNIDVWAFENAARAVAENPDDEAEVRQLKSAMIMYNVATTAVLVGPEMRLIVLSSKS